MLSPEEKEMMRRALAEDEGIGAGHPDAQADRQMIEQMIAPLVDAILYLNEKVEAQQEQIKALDEIVNEEIIGGITNLYHRNVRASEISGLRSKYGEKFGPYADKYKEAYGSDIFEKLHEHFGEIRGDDWNDEREVGEVDSLVEKLKGLLKVDMPEPAVAVEIKKTETEINPEDELKELVNRAKKARPND